MKITLFSFLRHPYALVTTLYGHLYRAAFLGIFVFVMLALIQPFNHNMLKMNLFLEASVLGLSTFTLSLLINIGVVPLFKDYFNSEKWTVGRELLWSLINLIIIGIGICVFNFSMTKEAYNVKDVINLEFLTILLGMIPIALAILYRQTRLKNKYHKSAELLNAKINSSRTGLYTTSKAEFDILKVNGNLQITVDGFLYAHRDATTRECYYFENNVLNQVMIEFQLEDIQKVWSQDPSILLCHPNYLVNLKKLIHITSNAQGYKLHFSGTHTLVPVASVYEEQFKKVLNR